MAWFDAALAVLALCVGVLWARPAAGPEAATEHEVGSAAPTEVVVRGGRRGMLDATGAFVALSDFRRIVSGSTVADDLLLALCEPERVLRFTRFSRDRVDAYRFAGKAMGTTLADVEAIVALRPDLVLTHSLGSPQRVARLREAGLTVFDLGTMQGLRTLLPNLRTAGALLGRGERGATLARSFSARMARIAQVVPASQRPRAVYLALHGDKIYGGTTGSSYHDVLEAAGVREAAADRYEGWPAYTAERLLELDPDLLITPSRMQHAVCKHPGLERLRACRAGRHGEHGAHGVVGVEGRLMGSPGLHMLEASEALFEAVHGG